MNPAYRLSDLAHRIGAQCHLKGDDLSVTGLAAIDSASASQLSFIRDLRYEEALRNTQAGAVILKESMLPACPVSALVVNDPDVAFAKVAALFDLAPRAPVGIHPSAVIDPSAVVPASCSIGPFVVIEEGVILGERVVIGAGSVIGAYTSIAEDAVLKARVVLYHRVKIGARCLIHSGAVLGSDGFGLVKDHGMWLKVPQLGGVCLEDEVEVGAGTTIDRGALQDTYIARGVKIDNQVHIAHNVTVGEGTAMAAQVGVAGSTAIGRHCLFAGKVGVNGHIRIGDQVVVTAMSGVSHDLTEAGVYSASIPVKSFSIWSKTLARLNRLDTAFERIKKLEKAIKKEKAHDE